MDDIVKKLRQQARGPVVRSGQMAMLEAADTIERLRQERDEVRRMLCMKFVEKNSSAPRSMRDIPAEAKAVAEERNWDCFKEVPGE